MVWPEKAPGPPWNKHEVALSTQNWARAITFKLSTPRAGLCLSLGQKDSVLLNNSLSRARAPNMLDSGELQPVGLQNCQAKDSPKLRAKKGCVSAWCAEKGVHGVTAGWDGFPFLRCSGSDHR